jgi:eukaryotic-like serine/threonine-protein kinase
VSTRMEMVVGAGRVLHHGRYVIEWPIGTPGGEGAVYQAKDLHARRRVAVKVIHPGLYGMFRDAFDAQIEFLAAVDNPWCIAVHDHFRIPPANGWPETAALVMHLADRSLADLIGPAGAGRATALAATADAARGLAELHRRGGTHNDVKPPNLLHVSGDGPPRWVLGDFGVAKLLDGTHAYQQSMDMRYAPPERIRWGQVRRPGDVFSLGMTLHEALCGELPGGFGDYVVSRALDRPAADLVAACLEVDPADRPSLEEVQRGLAHLGAPGAGGAAAPAPAPMPPRREQTLPPQGVVAAEPPTTRVPLEHTWIAPAPVRPPAPPRPSAAPARARKPLKPPKPRKAPREPRRRRRPIRTLFRLTFLVLLAMTVLTATSGVLPELARSTADRTVDRIVTEVIDRVDGVVGDLTGSGG